MIATPKKMKLARNNKTRGTRTKTKYRVSRIANPLYVPYPGALPLRIQNTMKFQVTSTLLSDGSGNAILGIRANDLYDPEVALGGQQPLYYDQMTAIYNHWTVLKSKMKIMVMPVISGLSPAEPAFVTMFIDDDDTPPPVGGQKERRSSRSYMIGNESSDPGHVIYWNAQSTFGGNAIDNQNLRGAAASGPAETAVFFVATSGANVNTTFKVFIDVEYTTVWSELKSIAGS